MSGPQATPGRSRSLLTALSLGGLLSGLALGIGANLAGSEPLRAAALASEPLGRLWITLLLVIVVPLVMATLFAAIVAPASRTIGRMAAASISVFVGLFALAGIVAVSAASPLLRLVAMDASNRDAIRAGVPGTPGGDGATAQSSPGWSSLNAAAATIRKPIERYLLRCLLLALAAGLVVRQLPERPRSSVARASLALARAMHRVVGVVLWLGPVAVFTLGFALGARTGWTGARLLASFIVIVCGLLVFFTALLYLVAVAGGRVPLRRFARAVLPAQTTAVGTRSSLASLPALLLGAGEEGLGLPPAVRGFVLPLAVASFKVNLGLSSPFKLLFLAHVVGIDLRPSQIAGFMLMSMATSFGVPGIPSGGSLFNLPNYVAAGIPIEAVLMLNAVDAIPDVFKTVTNVTADMTAAVLVTRVVGGDASVPIASAPVSSPPV